LPACWGVPIALALSGAIGAFALSFFFVVKVFVLFSQV
jgi:hypothetical protein